MSLYSMFSYSLTSTDDTLKDDKPSIVPKTEPIAELPDDADSYFDSEESSETELQPEKDQDNLLDAKFFKLWKDIPTIEEFIKPTKHKEDYLLYDEEGEEEMDSTLDHISSDLDYKDHLDEKKTSEMLIIGEEASEQLTLIEQTEKEEAVEEEEESEETESTESLDFQLPEYDDEVVRPGSTKAYEAAGEVPLAALADFEVRGSKEEQKVFLKSTLSDLIRAENLQKMQIVSDFLNEMIVKAVDLIEKVQTTATLRFNLDKRKLIRSLCSVYNDYVVETKVTDVLQKKIVDYCRRKKLVRYLTIDNLKTLEFEKNKLENNMKRLNIYLKMRTEIKAHLERVETKLQKELIEIRAKAYAEVTKFETLLKETCRIDSKSKYLLQVVNQKFAEMWDCRSKINQMRFRLLLKLDTQANLSEQLYNVQNFGEFSTVKYDAVQNEIRQIQEKINEKTAEHEKAAGRINEKIGKIVHIKQLNEISMENLEKLFLQYLELNAKFKKMRERKSKAYKVRHHLKNELKTIKGKGGLLDKKSLLLEYDFTVSGVKERHIMVDQMLKKVVQLQTRIHQLKAKSRWQSMKFARKSIISHRKQRRSSSNISSNTTSIELGLYPNHFSLISPEPERFTFAFRPSTFDNVQRSEKEDRPIICPAEKRTNLSRGKSVIIAENRNVTEKVDTIDANYLSKIKKVRKFETTFQPAEVVSKPPAVLNKNRLSSISAMTLKSFSNLKGVEDVRYPYPKNEWINTPTFMPL